MTKGHSKKTPGEVRIIGGEWKRTPLQVAAVQGLRPTPSRVRETLFNWLGQTLKGWHCMDAFAGTGALGFEAASRGASVVWMHEVDEQAFSQLQLNVRKLKADQIRLSQSDGLSALAQSSERSLDLIFLDPPFASPILEKALTQAARVVREGGWIYMESGRAFGEEELHTLGLALFRHVRAGMVHAHLVQAIA